MAKGNSGSTPTGGSGVAGTFDALSATVPDSAIGNVDLSLDSLTNEAVDVLSAITAYTALTSVSAAMRAGELPSTGYSAINSNVRIDGKRVHANGINHAKNSDIMQKLANAPIAKSARPAAVYRGLSLDTSQAAILSNLKAGDTHSLQRVSSFSKSQKLAEQWAGNGQNGLILKMSAKNMKRGRDIHKFSRYDNESEFISGGRFKINSVSTNKNGQTVWDISHL